MQYYVAIAGKQSGPYTEALVRELLANGTLTADSLAWYQGLPNWAPLNTVLPAAATTPPLPTAPATYATPEQFTTAQAPLPPLAQSLSPLPPYPRPAYELADRILRILAHFVDVLFLGLSIIPGAIIALSQTGKSDNQLDEPTIIAGICISALGLFAFAGYQIYLLSTQGQTLAKKLLNIKIVCHEDLSNPGFAKVILLRSIASFFLCFFLCLIPFIGWIIYPFVNFCFIFREDRRCIHDHIAGTIVVKA